MAKYSPGRYFGSVSERFLSKMKEYMVKDPDNILKNMAAVCLSR